MNNLQITLISAITLSLVACSIQKESETGDIKKCYQNIVGAGDIQDIEVLWLSTGDGNVKGEFYWLPAFKDKRLGSFFGEIIGDGSADVEYNYYQEGTDTTVSLLLTYDERSISVKGGDLSMGLNGELYRINCSEIIKK